MQRNISYGFKKSFHGISISGIGAVSSLLYFQIGFYHLSRVMSLSNLIVGPSPSPILLLPIAGFSKRLD